jgi:hypothetical protein
VHPRRAITEAAAGTLSRRREAALRRHLVRCTACQRAYDEEVRLVRALHGDADVPTADEDARLLTRVLDAARAEGLIPAEAPPPAPVSVTETTSRLTRLLDGLVLHPGPSLAAATAAVLLVASAILLNAGVPLGAPDALPPVVAYVVEAQGTTFDGETVALEEARGHPVREGQVIFTGPSGVAELNLESGGKVRLFPGTRARLNECGRVVALGVGRVWCEVDASEDPFMVRTPNGRAQVLGTSFVVEHTEGGRTDVRVISGRVEVVDAEGRGRVEVPAGKQSTLAQGRAPTEPTRFDARRDRLDWERFWSRIVEALQRAMEGVRDLLGGSR